MNKILLSLLLFGVFPLFGQNSTYTIDFNGYNTANLHNQDGWFTFKEWNGTADFQVSDLVGYPAADGTKAAFFSAGGPGVGRCATRKPSTNFDFGFQNGGVRTFTYDVHSNWWGTWVCLGFDKNNNKKMTPNQPATEPGEGGVIIASGGYDFPNSCYVQMPDGTKSLFTISSASIEKWSRIRVTIDLDANAGAGSLSLSVIEDLATSGTFVPAAGAQGLHMGLTPGSKDKNDPAQWDAITFHSQGATGAFDNLTFVKPSASFQFISFNSIPNRLTVDGPFQISATASSGLPVSFSVLSGPATVSGNTVTLTGQDGIVTMRASQAGGSGFDPAANVENTFEVIDAAKFPPYVDLRNPVEGAKVAVPQGLSPILLSAFSSVDHTDVLSVKKVEFLIGNEVVAATDHGNGHYTAWWQPSNYGNVAMQVKSYNNRDFSTVQTSNFEIVDASSNLVSKTFDRVHLKVGVGQKNDFFVLPAHVGAYDRIIGKLKITCPAGGCDPWDRVSSIKVKSHEGTWVEIIRYITPYGVACNHQIDLTDFFPILQGKVEMSVELGTFANGFEYTLDLEYRAGTPAHKYGHVNVLWKGGYSFGNMANLQPCETYWVKYPANASASVLKLVSTGHSWGDNNTGNAAEFHEDTHHIRINGNNAFDQHNWLVCNPNPQGCSPQNGTWYFARAGWCPGSIAPWFDFNMTPHINPNAGIEMRYIFDEDYVDLCSPSNPNCVSGVTCPNCTDPEAHPLLAVWANLITFSGSPNTGISSAYHLSQLPDAALLVRPNPSNGIFNLHFQQDMPASQMSVINISGQSVYVGKTAYTTAGDQIQIDLGDAPSGLYLLQISNDKGFLTKKLLKE